MYSLWKHNSSVQATFKLLKVHFIGSEHKPLNAHNKAGRSSETSLNIQNIFHGKQKLAGPIKNTLNQKQNRKSQDVNRPFIHSCPGHQIRRFQSWSQACSAMLMSGSPLAFRCIFQTHASSAR